MRAKRFVWAGLMVPFMLTGCLIVPHRGERVVMVPVLPPVVVLGPEPYYQHSGYHYYYRDNGWAYSRSRNGPWTDLPRDHYPREIRYKDGGPGRGHGQNPGHQGR